MSISSWCQSSKKQKTPIQKTPKDSKIFQSDLANSALGMRGAYAYNKQD